MRRALPERARWLSAVLIVAAIAAATAAIVGWPLPPAPSVPPLASRPRHIIDPPRSLGPSRVFEVNRRHAPAPALRPSGDLPAPAAPVALSRGAEPPGTAAEAPVGDPAAAPLLASRRLDITPVAPPSAMPAPAGPAVAASPHGLVEIPVVAVARAVTIAGRGLRTALRVTAAVFRAAF